MASFLPVLSQDEISYAAQLIQQANSPQSALAPAEQKALQAQLVDVQRRPQAWGLIAPLLESADPYVQFFGAHTAQVKIARDWDSYPHELDGGLRDLLLQLLGASIAARRERFITRKLFVAVTALALRLASLPASDASHWEGWALASVQTISAAGASVGASVNDYVLEFLEIAAQEVSRADLLGTAKARMQQTLNDAVPTVVQITSAVVQTCGGSGQPNTAAVRELGFAMKTLEAWLPILPASELNSLLPFLLGLLGSCVNVSSDGSLNITEEVFVPLSDAFQEILSSAVFSNGAGSKTLTEPLLLFVDALGTRILAETRSNGDVANASRAFCKLLVALGDHSSQYLANHLASPALVVSSGGGVSGEPRTRGALSQTFLRVLLGYTALPGAAGVDEDESELTLGFWYLFQEALWAVDEPEDTIPGAPGGLAPGERERMTVARQLYAEVVRVLRQKVVWPASNIVRAWPKDAKDKFKVYRRDAGDALINAYYVLREEMTGYFVSDILERLPKMPSGHSQGWEEIEGTLHCILSIQEAIPVEKVVSGIRGVETTHAQYGTIFGSDVLGRLPTTGHERVRLTMVNLLGEYASLFTVLPERPAGQAPTGPPILMNALSYVVAALREPQLCLAAANALRDLCDANRDALAPHVGAFAELHAGLATIPDTERSKVLQSIASVIQALPPDESIPPVEALVTPILQKLAHVLQSPGQPTDEARTAVIQQLQTLTGVAKGLTRANDDLFSLEASPELTTEEEKMNRARADPRIVKLRNLVLDALGRAVDIWSADASVSDALSDLLKAITSLPSDATVLSLPAGPLLEMVCVAARRQLTAVWLSLASSLIVQLDPPPLFPPALKSMPNEEALRIVRGATPVLLETTLSALAQPDAMEDNPDVVQAFFGGMEKIAQHFVITFYELPAGGLDTLMQAAVRALGLQERYSLAYACSFLSTLVTCTAKKGDLGSQKDAFASSYGRMIVRAVLAGLAGVAPRSAAPNLVDLLSTFTARYPAESRAWASEILFANDFVPSKAGDDAKRHFVQAIAGPRSTKRMREAANAFTLVARGLEGSSFGYSSVVS